MASDSDPVAELLVPGLPALLDDIGQAVIVHDASGRIRLLNAAARLLFPGLRLGAEFRRSDEEFVAGPGARPVSGRLRPLADGWQAWVISDVDFDACPGTGGLTSNSDRDSIGGQAESANFVSPIFDSPNFESPNFVAPDFMVEAGRELAIEAGHDAAAAALVRLAVPTVAAQAAVLLPAPRARVSWWRFAGDAAPPAQGMTRTPAARIAPVLAGALRGTASGSGTDSGTDTVTVPADELPALGAVFGSDVTEKLPVVAAPLRGPDRTEGLLIVVAPVSVTLLGQLAALAGPIIAASRRRREQATALALLQAPLLPPRPGALPELPGIQLGVAYQAAGDLAVGGDFYLFRPKPDRGAIFGLGDVCGKGAEALAESGRVQHSLSALMITEQDPTQLLYLLNRALLAGGRTVFTTLVLGALRPIGEAHQLTLATGGHPAPMVLRSSGQVEEVTVPGTVVGILPDARFGRTTITLRPGETLLLYSDGVTEAGHPGADGSEQFGSARLAACLRDCAGMTAQAVATRVERTIAGWLGRNDGDDLAVLALRAVERGG
ncbi:MAG TPA: PP2C family protein-serine/threonine phosphatase [Pseudonocardiaceae bacterium]|nr:PP2C family protein-serine/threonine phosphatase [Pseudonocardiaceae bacterium]